MTWSTLSIQLTLATFIILWNKNENYIKVNYITLINVITILMMSAKLSTPSLLKTTIFWKESYDVIISGHDITSKNLSRDPNYVNYHNFNFIRIEFDEKWPEMRGVILIRVQ